MTHFFVMTLQTTGLLLALFVVFALSNRVHYEDVSLENDGTWKVLDRVDGTTELRVRFALHQRNLDVLERVFMEVSDPASPKFHQYWTRDEIVELVSPPKFEQQIVVSWALQSGCSSATSHGDFVEVQCSVSQIEEMLGGVEIHWVNDVLLDENLPKIISGSYSLPHEIGRLVQFVQNLAMNVHKRKMGSYKHASERISDTPSEDLVIPETLFNLYNISYTITTQSSQNVAEFTSKGYEDSDLSSFVAGCGLPTPQAVTAVGSYSPTPPDTECTLDIQMITSVGQNGVNYYYTVDGWVLDFAQELLTTNNPPMVNSISWSSDERTEGKVMKQFLFI